MLKIVNLVHSCISSFDDFIHIRPAFYHYIIIFVSESCTHTKVPLSCPRTDGKAWWNLEFSTDIQVDEITIWRGVKNLTKIDGMKVLSSNLQRNRKDYDMALEKIANGDALVFSMLQC